MAPRITGFFLMAGFLLLYAGLVFEVPPVRYVYRSDTVAILTGLFVVLSFVVGYTMVRRSRKSGARTLASGKPKAQIRDSKP